MPVAFLTGAGALRRKNCSDSITRPVRETPKKPLGLVVLLQYPVAVTDSYR